jgi:hypothetical protein
MSLFFAMPIITVDGLRFDDHLCELICFIVDRLIYINMGLYPSELGVIQITVGRCIGCVGMWIRNLKLMTAFEHNLIHLPSFQELSGKSHLAISDELHLTLHSTFVVNNHRFGIVVLRVDNAQPRETGDAGDLGFTDSHGGLAIERRNNLDLARITD